MWLPFSWGGGLINKRQKEVLEYQLEEEKKVIQELEKRYNQALKDINEKVKLFQADIDLLDEALSQDGLDDATKALLQSQMRSKVYQQTYQRALKSQISGILDKMQGDNFAIIDKYLNGCYETGYIGTLYDIAGQGIPIITPVDQAAVVKAVQLDSKISNGLYSALGMDTKRLKKNITQEISRGIASSLSYSDISRNLKNTSGVPLYNAKRIVRTESHRIQQQSAEDSRRIAKNKGADIVRMWDAALDGRTRDSHRMVDGEIRELDEKFSNGLMFPGDPSGSAAEVVNCRCVALTRARWALDDGELQTLKERAEYFGLDKTKNFEEFREKFLGASEELSKAEADNPVKNKFGDTIIFDDKMNAEKWQESVGIIKQLSEEYDTRLYKVAVGSHQAAGSVDMGGLLRLSSSAPDTAYHEFAHSMAMESLTKFGVVDDSAFWKEIKAVRRSYIKDVGADTARWISTYEHGTRSVDEFLAEAFTQAKMSQLGIPLPDKYGNDLTYSNRVLAIVDEYFKKPLENSVNGSTIKLPDIQIGRSLGAKLKDYAVLDLETGEYFTFVEGSKLQNVEVFAGKGTKKELRIAGKYAERYGGNPEDWQHVKGHGILDTDDGDRKAEVHWMQCEGYGKHDFFVKKWED